MDTGNIMQNQMDALIEQGMQIQNEICEQAIFIYKNHKVSPAELLSQRDELLKASKKICEVIRDETDPSSLIHQLVELEEAIQKTTGNSQGE